MVTTDEVTVSDAFQRAPAQAFIIHRCCVHRDGPAHFRGQLPPSLSYSCARFIFNEPDVFKANYAVRLRASHLGDVRVEFHRSVDGFYCVHLRCTQPSP